MSRYIDADPIYDKVEANYRRSEGVKHECEREFLNLICDAQTVDAVQVVRCRECEYWLECRIRTDNDGERYSRCCLNGIAVGESFYCADGERKDLQQTCNNLATNLQHSERKDGERRTE